MMKKIFSLFFSLFLVPYFLISQNIGIGTQTPTRAKVEVHGAAGYTSGIFGGESSGISLQRNWPSVGFNEYFSTASKYMSNGYGAKILFDPNVGSMAIDMFGNGVANNNTFGAVRALTIGNNGNMGIKISPTNASLCVLKAGNFDGSAIFGGTTYNSYFNYGTAEDTYIRGGRNNGKVILNDIPGGHVIIGNGGSKVGINNGNGVPYFTLEIRQAGTGLGLIHPDGFNTWELLNNVVELRFQYNGNTSSFIQPNGNYVQVSDSRLKKNVEKIPSVFDKIMQLKPVMYEMNTNNPGAEKSIGFIAQDVKKIFPELVYTSKGKTNGYGEINEMLLMNYSGFGVLAISGIQEQQQQLNEMKKEIELLKEQNKLLMQLLKNKN